MTDNNPHEQILQLLITGGFLDPGKLKEARDIIGKCAPSPDQTLEEAAEEYDPFITKHLAIIKEKLLENFVQSKMQHLQRPPFDASVKYFLEKGTVNGNFMLAIKDVVYGLPRVIRDELAAQSSRPSIDIVDELRKANPHKGSAARVTKSFMSVGWNECCDKLQELLNQSK